MLEVCSRIYVGLLIAICTLIGAIGGLIPVIIKLVNAFKEIGKK